jgi:hypothetical protein
MGEKGRFHPLLAVAPAPFFPPQREKTLNSFFAKIDVHFFFVARPGL